MPEHAPEELLPQLRRTLLAGVGKIMAARRRRPAHRRERPRMQPPIRLRSGRPQTVAPFIERQRVSALRKEQRRAMAPRAESAAERPGARLPRQPGHEMIGDEIANLPQHAELAAD